MEPVSKSLKAEVLLRAIQAWHHIRGSRPSLLSATSQMHQACTQSMLHEKAFDLRGLNLLPGQNHSVSNTLRYY